VLELRLEDDAGGEYVGFAAPTAVSPSYTLTMPAADAAGALTSNGSGVMSFVVPTTGTVTKFAQNNATAVAAEVFTHSLGTQDVIVQVWDLTVTPRELMIADVEATSTTTVTVTLAVAPAIDDYRVVIMA